jgi:hypothetical protein
MLVFTVLVGLAVTSATVVALVPWLDGLIDRERARNAADAAALAGVTGGRDASATLAADNGGVLVSWKRDGAAVTVTVRVDDSRATARATNGP